MKYSSDLYDLIQRLTQTEKRYVKLFAKAFSSKGTSTQLDLFDAFEKQSVYNEEKIRAHFKAKIPDKNFHVYKNRLYQLVLKALVQYHAANNQQYKLFQQLFQAELLKRKGLYQQSMVLIDKTLEEAASIEHYSILLFALTRKLSHAIYSRDMEAFQAMIDHGFLSEFKMQLSHFEEQLSYVFLEVQTMLLIHRKQVIRSETDLMALEQIQKHHLLQEDYSPKGGKKSKETYIFLNAFLNRYSGDYEKACHYMSLFVEELKEKATWTKDDLSSQISNINNLMFMQLEGLFFDEAFDNCLQLKDLLKHPLVLNDEHLQLRIKERVLEFNIQYFLGTHRFQDGIDYIVKEAALVEMIENEATAFRVIVLQYNLAALYLSVLDYKKADDYLQQVLYHPGVKEHEYVYSGAMIFQLLIHLGLGNRQLLGSLLLNIQRNMSKQKLLYKSEKILLKQLKKIQKTEEKADLIKLLKTVCTELLTLQNHDPSERFFLDQFDLINWLSLYQKQV